MVRQIMERYALDSPGVLSVMLQVPREKFVAGKYINIAYEDRPVSIGFGQTMSQPYTVAFMTHLLLSLSSSLSTRKKSKEKRKDIKSWRVLEVGTGSGYQAAILSHLVKEVYTIEIIPQLAKKARKTLKKLGYKNVHVKTGSGEWGWEEEAPFDAIMVTAGLEKEVPRELLEQLKVGGVLVAPIGRGVDKQMTKYTKFKSKNKFMIKREEFGVFHFVPFIEEKNN